MITCVLGIVIYLLKQVSYVELDILKEITDGSISKGSFAEIIDHPYMVLVSVTKDYELKKEKRICGGTIITKLFVLTTAHCVLCESQDTITNCKNIRIEVIAGIDNTREIRKEKRQIQSVVKVFPHPMFETGKFPDNKIHALGVGANPIIKQLHDMSQRQLLMSKRFHLHYWRSIVLPNLSVIVIAKCCTREYDVALLQLKSKLIFTHRVNLINLPSEHNPEMDALFQSGSSSLALGWVVVEDIGETKRISGLKIAPVSFRPITKCTLDFKNQLKICKDVHICTSGVQYPNDICDEDSGGPLIYNGVQVGIRSVGTDCKEHARLYARIDAVSDWISGVVEAESNYTSGCSKTQSATLFKYVHPIYTLIYLLTTR